MYPMFYLVAMVLTDKSQDNNILLTLNSQLPEDTHYICKYITISQIICKDSDLNTIKTIYGKFDKPYVILSPEHWSGKPYDMTLQHARETRAEVMIQQIYELEQLAASAMLQDTIKNALQKNLYYSKHALGQVLRYHYNIELN